MSRFLTAGDDALRPSAALADARRAIEEADVHDDAERHRKAILDFVDDHDDALHRSCRPGHLTGSALVVDDDGERVVMLHHRKLRRWLQPGGHCDGDANLAAVALREATEETALDDLGVHPVAIDLDVHRVEPPGEVPHLHLDARFVVVASAGAEPVGNDESTAIRWATPAELRSMDVDAGTLRMVDHGLRLLARLR